MTLEEAVQKLIDVGRTDPELSDAITIIINKIQDEYGYVKRVLTNEQILDFVLRSLALKDYNMEGIEGEVVVAYVMSQYGDDLTDDEMNEKVKEIVSSHELQSLCADGFITPDFEKTTNQDTYYFVSDELRNILTEGKT